jgi:hypothetical protein
MTNLITAIEIADFTLHIGFRIATLASVTPAGREWLRDNSAVGKHSTTILIDADRANDFIQRIKRSGLTVSCVREATPINPNETVVG